jgi:copper transport protein
MRTTTRATTSTEPAGRILRRSVAVVLLMLAAVLLTPAAASAHATLQRSDPASGTTLPTAPTAITLSFNEPVQPIADGIVVFDPKGTKVTSGKAKTEPGNRMTVGLESGLGQGTYTVSWRVNSADSHPVSAAFTFNVGKASATDVKLDTSGVGSSDRTVGFGLGVFRWLAFGSFALLTGSAVFLFACWPAGTAVPRARRILIGSAVALAVATVGELLVYGPYLAGESVGGLADPGALGEGVTTRLGAALLIRLALLAAAGGLLWWLLVRMPAATRRERLLGGGAGALLAASVAATWSAAGHASTGRQVALALPADVTHLLAMGTWLGGLTVLALVLLARPGTGAATAGTGNETGRTGDAGGGSGRAGGAPAVTTADVVTGTTTATATTTATSTETAVSAAATGTETGPETGTETRGGSEAEELEPAVARFSRLALCCVAALVVTGGYQAWRQAGGIDAMTSTDYGQTLTIKLGVFAGLIGLAYVTRGVLRYQFREEGGVRLLRRMVAAEAGVALGILAVTAVLVNAQPAKDAYAAEQAAARGPGSVVQRTVPWDTGSSTGGKGTVALTMSPSRVGKNNMRVVILDERGQARQAGSLRVVLANPERGIGSLAPQVFPGAGTGEYFVSNVEIPLPGTWTVRLFIRTTDVDEAFLSTKVAVG